MSTTPSPPPDRDAPLLGYARHIDKTDLTAVIWVFFAVASLFVWARVGVRWRQNHRLLIDDYWMLFAWICSIASSILQTLQLPALFYITELDAGHIAAADADVAILTQLSVFQFPLIKLFWTILWSIKASFLALFYRLVCPITFTRWAWYAVATFTFLAYVGCWISSTTTCNNVADYFVPGACNSEYEEWRQRFNVIYSTSVDVASDIMIMALPIAVLPSLQLNTRKKAGLGVAFSLGLVIIGVAIVRMSQVIFGQTVDLVGLAIWGSIETSVALIVGSLLPLKALISRSAKKYSSKKASSQKYDVGGADSGLRPDFTPGSASRTIMVADPIPLDDLHRSAQINGGIYVQRTYEMHIENDNSSKEYDDEVAIVKGRKS